MRILQIAGQRTSLGLLTRNALANRVLIPMSPTEHRARFSPFVAVTSPRVVVEEFDAPSVARESRVRTEQDSALKSPKQSVEVGR